MVYLTLITSGLNEPTGIDFNSSFMYVANYNNNTINRYFISPPTNVVASPGINSVDLSWNSVSGATSYIISYKTDADSVWQTKTFTPN
jgi:hypothetical protein